MEPKDTSHPQEEHAVAKKWTGDYLPAKHNDPWLSHSVQVANSP